MHRPYRDLQNLKFSCLYLFPFSHKVVPQKASGGGGGCRRGGGGGVVYHTSTGQYIGVATFFLFFFFFFESGLKLRMVSKVSNFWLCVFSGVVATTLIMLNVLFFCLSIYYPAHSQTMLTAIYSAVLTYGSLDCTFDPLMTPLDLDPVLKLACVSSDPITVQSSASIIGLMLNRWEASYSEFGKNRIRDRLTDFLSIFGQSNGS